MIRAVALVLTVLTGFSGLIYEVTWQKYLATLLGSHSEATAAVLGIFLGGLSVGYALFGRIVRRLFARASTQSAPTRLLVLYGVIEAGIGIWALLFPTLFSGVHALSLQLALDSQGLGFALDVFFTVLLVGPPAVLMGGTIPILTQALSRGLEDATRFHAFVYGFNTTGAFAGALAGAFVLIPALGLDATLAWMGAVNIVAGVLFALLGLRAGPALPPPDAPDAAVPEGFGSYAAAALLLGFGMMSIQTVLIRLGGLALGSSQFTFATVVAVFVLCIAIGSLCVSAFRNIPRAIVVACPATLALLLVLLYFALPDTTYGAYVLRTLFSSEAAAFLPTRRRCSPSSSSSCWFPWACRGRAFPSCSTSCAGKSANWAASPGGSTAGTRWGTSRARSWGATCSCCGSTSTWSTGWPWPRWALRRCCWP